MADITLAAIPLSIKLIADCLNGYKLFTQAKELGRDSQKLLWKFRIQEARLRIWGKEWGLIDEHLGSRTFDTRDPNDYKIISESLLRISEILKDYRQLEDITETIDQLIASEFAGYHRDDVDLQYRRAKANGFLKKFRWAAADRGKLETIISDLRDYNDGLYHLLSSAERRKLYQALAPELVTSNDPSELQNLQQAYTGPGNVPQLVRLKAQRIKVQGEESLLPSWLLNSSLFIEDLQIPGTEIKFIDSLSSPAVPQKRALATYTPGIQGQTEGKIVLVEWKSFDKQVGDTVRLAQLSRLGTLARLLHISSKPTELLVPHCIGYISDDFNPRIGFVFEYPALDDNISVSPKSLHDWLGSSEIPYLGDRFRLAYELSLSLCLLHTAGWLRKGIQSQNIVFFHESPASLQKLQYPKLLGFEYSRPDNLHTISDAIISADWQSNIYRHPKSQGPARSRFSRAYDIYSLGVVLVEIGYWRRASEFWHESHTMETFQQDLQTFYTPKLGAKMGHLYMDVVSRCLEGKLTDDIAEENGSETGFYWKIVHELSQLVA